MDMDTHELIAMSVVAKPGFNFAGYDLLQTILASGMQFGDMNIFHYFLPGTPKVALFSLASTTEPGSFDWDHIGDFSCTGLTLFIDLCHVPAPDEAFALMVATAEQLADELDGEIRAGQYLPWNEEVLRTYEQKVSQYV